MQNADALRSFYSRVAPAVPELFNMAHAICGNYDLAEYSLQYTLMEAWVGESHGGMGFREGLRSTLRRVALEEALENRAESPEFTWNGLAADSDDPVLKQLAQESVELRRAAALSYGCGLSVQRIAQLTGASAGQVREMLQRLERRVGRKLSAKDRRRADVALRRAVSKQLARADEDMPSLGAVYRSFAAEAAETRRPSHAAARIVRRILFAVLIVICGAVFWLTAVLIQPTPVETPQAQNTETAQ